MFFEILISHGGMFAAWNEKPKKPKMSSQNIISLPSMGPFVGDLAQKKAKRQSSKDARFYSGNKYFWETFIFP